MCRDGPPVFARTAAQTMALSDPGTPIERKKTLGSQFNTSETVALSSKVWPASFLNTDNGSKLRVLLKQEAHIWLRCMINLAGSWHMHLGLQHHLSLHQRFSTPTNRHCVTKAGRFHIDSATSKRLSSPVAGFGASHRALHKNDLAKLNVEYHRLMRMVVGLPGHGAFRLRWAEALVCHMHRGSMDIGLLCCNLALGTLDPHDYGMEHQGRTATHTTSLHLGNSAGNILSPERL